MEYRVRVEPAVNRTILSWNLSDTLFVEVHLRMNGIRLEYLSCIEKPFAGMAFGFSIVDPDNRLREHDFLFQVMFGSDEQTLIVSRAFHQEKSAF